MVLASFHGVNTSIMADCKLQMWYHWVQNWEEMHKVDPRESVQDTVYTCGPVQNDFLLKILPHKYTKALVKEKIKGKITSNWELKQRKLAEDFFFF